MKAGAILPRLMGLPYVYPPFRGGPMARLRYWYWHFVRRYPGELCQLCGRCYLKTAWWSPDDLWLNLTDGAYGLLCPACFGELAEARGAFLRWTPTPIPLTYGDSDD